MTFKNFLISITKSLIVLFLATFIFSTVNFEFPDLIKGVFSDIFAYSSPEAQKQVVSQLTESCSSLEQGDAVTLNQLCANRSLLDSMRENCRNYRDLKGKGIEIENEEQVKKTCLQLESGEIEKQCQKNGLVPDFSKIADLCNDYKTGIIDNKEFFLGFIGSALPADISQIGAGTLGKYNQAVNYLNKNKVIYFVALTILLFALYSLIREPRLFLFAIGNISLSLGLLVMLPYFAVLAYAKFVGFDTTQILGSMFGSGNILDPEAIISMVLLLLLRTYNAFVITVGIVLLAAGVISKAYEKMLSVAPKEPKSYKKSKKVDKLMEELKGSMKKKKP